MNIYDEAIKRLNEFRNRHYNDNDEESRDIAQALNVVLPKISKDSERAKKEHELLGLYRRRPLYINSVQFDEIDKLIKLKEKELEELK